MIEVPIPERSIKTRQQVEEIFKTDRRITILSAALLIALRKQDNVRAARISRTIADIKRRMLEKYGIIL